ncbi:MAG TPA: hypothetical protein VKV74_07800 [Bryobacteraceae bacterium]|nr:hypothetical protein [Bryobacteraceae bacterium]
MLRNVEQAMWYINMAAAAVLFGRLYVQGLVRAYPFLFAYLAVDTLEQIIASAFAQNLRFYTEIYFVGQTVKVGLAIFVILELYELALAQQPALARFGRRMLGYLFLIAIAFGFVNLLLEFDAADPNRGTLLVSFLRLERSMDLVTFVVLILIAVFLLWFPVRARRNVAVWLGGFLLYSFSRWTGLLLMNRFHQLTHDVNRFQQLTHELNVAMLGASLACLIGWCLMLKPAGEQEMVVTGHAWDPAEMERLTVQLDAINSRLVRMARY